MTALPPAPFWRRYAAWSLDFALLGTVATVLAWPRMRSGWEMASVALHALFGVLGHALRTGVLQGTAPQLLAQQLLDDPRVHAAAGAMQCGLDRAALAWLLAYVVLAALYHIGFEASAWRGSPGKHALELRVAGVGTTTASLPRIWVRHVAGALSWLTLNLGHAMVLATPRKRALHDVIAGLRVESAAVEPRLPAWARAWLALQAVAVVALLVWCLQRYVAALQASLG